MRRIIFILFLVLPVTALAQEPWKEFMEVDKDTGRGSVGYGSWDWYTRVDGVFKGSKPGNGVDICDVWIWQKGKFMTHEAYVLDSKKYGPMQFALIKNPGHYESQSFTDGGSWEDCILGPGVMRSGLIFDAKKQTLFKGTWRPASSTWFIDGILIDYNTRKQQMWTNERMGPWDPLDDDSVALMEQYGTAHAFSVLKNNHPDMFNSLLESVSGELQEAIRRPQTKRGLALGRGDIDGLTNVFRTYPFLKAGVKPEDADRIVAVIIEKMRELGRVTKDYVAAIWVNYPEDIIRNPAFKRCLFRQIAEDSYHDTGRVVPFDRTDYYAFYHDYADLSAEEILELDNAVFQRIRVLKDMEYYRRLFPRGQHIAAVNDMYADGTGAGLYRLQIAELESDFVSRMRSFMSDRVIDGEKGPFDFSGKPVNVTSLTAFAIRDNQKRDPEIERYLSMCSNLKRLYPDDYYFTKVIDNAVNYLRITDGFWAVDNATDMKSCVGEEFFSLQSSLSPRTAVSPTNFGYEVKRRFEEAFDIIASIQDKNGWSDYLLTRTYDYLYDKYEAYVNAVNEKVHSENVSRNRRQRNDSEFLEYDFDDNGRLVIHLKNYDRYVYEMEKGKWHFVSGNITRDSSVPLRHDTIDQAIEASEKASYEYWGVSL